jgi:hypothetical protein
MADTKGWLTGAIDTGDEKYFPSLLWSGAYTDPLVGFSTRIWFSIRIKEDAVQADSDRRVLMNLETQGANLDQPHQTEWFLYFPTEGLAQSAEAILSE